MSLLAKRLLDNVSFYAFLCTENNQPNGKILLILHSSKKRLVNLIILSGSVHCLSCELIKLLMLILFEHAKCALYPLVELRNKRKFLQGDDLKIQDKIYVYITYLIVKN